MMERLARLPMYKAMSGDMLDKIITGMRKNPKLIDYLEQESKSTKMMMQMKEDGAEVPVEDMEMMGMKLHQFDKEKRLDKVSF